MSRWRRKSAPSPSRHLLNRELSHLEFHARVLELATDETLPLLERVKFCGIFSSNLDEFFQVRVAGLLGQAEAGILVRSADGLTPQQALARIRERVLELSALQSTTLEARASSGARCRGNHRRRHRGSRARRSSRSSSVGSTARSTRCSRRSRSAPASRSRTSRASRSRSRSSRRIRRRATSASRA